MLHWASRIQTKCWEKTTGRAIRFTASSAGCVQKAAPASWIWQVQKSQTGQHALVLRPDLLTNAMPDQASISRISAIFTRYLPGAGFNFLLCKRCCHATHREHYRWSGRPHSNPVCRVDIQKPLQAASLFCRLDWDFLVRMLMMLYIANFKVFFYLQVHAIISCSS